MIDVIVLYIDPVNRYDSLAAIVKSLEELDDGRFAAPRRANEAYLLPFVNLKTERVEDGSGIVRIAEQDLIELDVTFNGTLAQPRALSDLYLLLIFSI
ncbi:unnamed protein product [Sphagnum balticum]